MTAHVRARPEPAVPSHDAMGVILGTDGLTTGYTQSRRAFLASALADAAALSLAACTGGRGSGGAGGSGSDSLTALYPGQGDAENIDPGTAYEFIDEARAKHLYDGLFEADAHMAPLPRLASAAEPNADATSWLLTLRDARWHDGDPLTPDDVLYTLSRILGPQLGAKPFIAASTLGDIDLSASGAVGRNQVRIALSRPNVELPSSLAAWGTRIVKSGAKDMNSPVGTGPFRFESFAPGRDLVLHRNEDYWDPATSGGNIGELHIGSADVDARLSALRSGQADFADNLTTSALRTVDGAKDIATNSAPHSSILYFAMKTDRPPFDNPDVRRAMMRLVDREALVRVALEDNGEVSNDVFGKGFQYYADDLPQHTYDPDEAGRLLAKAGVGDLRFELFTAPVANGLQEASELLREQAAAAGVTIDIRTGSKDTYYSEALKSGDMVVGESGPLTIPYHFGSRVISSATKNVTHWNNPEFDDLYTKALRTKDDDARAAIYHSMHEMLWDQGGYIFWGIAPWNTAASSALQNPPVGTVNTFDWARFAGTSRGA